MALHVIYHCVKNLRLYQMHIVLVISFSFSQICNILRVSVLLQKYAFPISEATYLWFATKSSHKFLYNIKFLIPVVHNHEQIVNTIYIGSSIFHTFQTTHLRGNQLLGPMASSNFQPPPKKCLKTSISPGLTFGILWYIVLTICS